MIKLQNLRTPSYSRRTGHPLIYLLVSFEHIQVRHHQARCDMMLLLFPSAGFCLRPILKSVLRSCQSLNRRKSFPRPLFRAWPPHQEPSWEATARRDATPQVRQRDRHVNKNLDGCTTRASLETKSLIYVHAFSLIIAQCVFYFFPYSHSLVPPLVYLPDLYYPFQIILYLSSLPSPHLVHITFLCPSYPLFFTRHSSIHHQSWR